MKTTKEQIIADITAKVEAKLESHKIELSTLDEIKTASESVKKQYDSVFQKAMTALSNVNEGVKIGNKAFFDAQKFYQQGVKIEQQLKELGVPVPSDFKKSMDTLYKYSQLEGEQIVKELNQAKKILG
jgi:hypothetical protein